ncbi:MAG: type II toxin-antitoxin system RelE/ParE family toxin [Coriobacteriales bacterium]|nr:type II toxin-antitoxin system RelE/ParE family toxin [Coriobacteriales bacterium]
MAYEVVIDPGVAARLDEAVGYVMEVLGSPGAAAGILDGFDELIGRLEQSPLSYPLAQDERLQVRGYRRALIGKYIVLFRVWEDGEHEGTVWVTNLFHGSQNYQGLV